MKHILWLNADQMGCGTYRCLLPALALKEAGVADSSWFDHQHCLLGVEGQIDTAQLEGIDALVIQRPSSPIFVDWMVAAQARGIPVLLELDDDLFHLPRHNPAFGHYTKPHIVKALLRIAQGCMAIVVSTVPLQQAVAEACRVPLAKIWVCPNHLHEAAWGPEVLNAIVPHDNLGAIVIGWQGSRTHDSDFRMALPALRAIVQARPQVRIRLFGDVPLSIRGQLPGSSFEWLKGVPFDIYPAMLRRANFDIGIAPITPSKFNRAKSNIKLLEYGALALPVVASRVYPYERTLRHGETGYLAATDQEWYDALWDLVESPERRQQMGAAWHAEVHARWTTAQHGPAWIRVMETIWQAQPAVTATS